MSDITSPEQDDWQEIAQRLRLELSKRIEDVAVMEPCELLDFVRALVEAEELEMDAKVRDQRLAKYTARLTKPWEQD